MPKKAAAPAKKTTARKAARRVATPPKQPAPPFETFNVEEIFAKIDVLLDEVNRSADTLLARTRG
jgi:hypothetical protein